ncbi:MAG: hypothetical protein KKG64_05485 [Firmicutes bacterium]|nr:hypothetical protein [Bacillota bacterium]
MKMNPYKKMITNLKRLYISLISLSLIVMIFGTVTYAWISMASINSLDGMSLTATSGNELLISIDGITYSRELPSIAIENLIRDVSLTDITSVDGIHFSRGGLNEGETVIPNYHYVSFELWLQTDRPEHNIYLVENVNQFVQFDTTMSGTYVVSQGVTWESNYTFSNGPTLDDIIEKDEEHIYYASQAVRMSFQEIKDTANLLDLRSEEELTTFVYDPSENEQRGYGVSYGAFSYFLASTQTPIALPVQMQEVSYRLSTFDYNNPYLAENDDSMVATLQPSDSLSESGKTLYRGKIIINVWIEGWDADAFDSILNDRIKIQLKFKAAKSSS